eukprot:s2272_g13.t1
MTPAPGPPTVEVDAESPQQPDAAPAADAPPAEPGQAEVEIVESENLPESGSFVKLLAKGHGMETGEMKKEEETDEDIHDKWAPKEEPWTEWEEAWHEGTWGQQYEPAAWEQQYEPAAWDQQYEPAIENDDEESNQSWDPEAGDAGKVEHPWSKDKKEQANGGGSEQDTKELEGAKANENHNDAKENEESKDKPNGADAKQPDAGAEGKGSVPDATWTSKGQKRPPDTNHGGGDQKQRNKGQKGWGNQYKGKGKGKGKGKYHAGGWNMYRQSNGWWWPHNTSSSSSLPPGFRPCHQGGYYLPEGAGFVDADGTYHKQLNCT